MDPRVRDLYKRFIVVGRDYPLGLSYVRDQAKAQFQANASLQGDKALHQAVTRGRYMVRELVALMQLKKYRALRRAYASPDEEREISEGMRPDVLSAKADEAVAQGKANDEE